MCFCLRRANRLLPNQLSFQLRPTQQTRRRGYDVADEEEGDPESRTGLLSEGQYDHDDEDDRYADRRDWGTAGFSRQQDTSTTRQLHEESDEEEFGDMQGAPTVASPDTTKPRTPLFNIADDDDDDSDDEDVRNKKRV
ncbi:hypothetical protein BJV82DRAFT_94366 [Fennellomyces sp. T-0311]|nr:hypothetical protein BJV82DRAFT_94366 [Fennellomyces sp. T-0311]